MTVKSLNKTITNRIEKAVGKYEDRYQDYLRLTQKVVADFSINQQFNALIHSSKSRAKDPSHLKDKLFRKAYAIKNKKDFDISPTNIFERIDDLAGVRFLHLHTKQIESIHPLILEILKRHKYELVSQPIAYTWDIEYKQLFEKVGIETELRESMYTSAHYIVTSPYDPSLRCEIQVRTLMEELWGEVSHTINYPHETDSVPCKEQLFALARIASGCTRLVDSIFTSHAQHCSQAKPKIKKSSRKS